MPLKFDSIFKDRPTSEQFVDSVVTPLTAEEAAYYLKTAWKIVEGEFPSDDTLAILWAQSALESGRWKLLRNYNYGNIKKRVGIKYTSYECGEVINGKHQMFYPYHPETFFAAWDSALEGAVGYIQFLKQRERYKKAYQALKEGNENLFVSYLKDGGYFTASLEHYKNLIGKLTKEFKNKKDTLIKWSPDISKDINAVANKTGNTIYDIFNALRNIFRL